MNYRTQVILWVIGLILLGVIVSWLAFGGKNTSRREHAGVSSQIRRIVFRCSHSKTIKAHFSDSYVRLILSNGQHFMLKHVVSASGARYSNKDQRIVFWNKGNTAFITKDDSMWFKHCVQKGQDDLVNLRSFEDPEYAVGFRFPQVLHLYRRSVADTGGWSYASTKKGALIAQFSFNDSLMNKTNLLTATFTVGRSRNPQAVKKCLKPARPRIQSDTVQRGGAKFIRSKYTDAGAGNLYHIRQYRTIYHQSCYSIEEMIHSTHVQNYPSELGVTAFDSERVWKALDVPWETFAFK